MIHTKSQFSESIDKFNTCYSQEMAILKNHFIMTKISDEIGLQGHEPLLSPSVDLLWRTIKQKHSDLNI